MANQQGKRGRPKSNDPDLKTARFVVRCTPENKALFEAAAAADNRSAADWARLALIAAAQRKLSE